MTATCFLHQCCYGFLELQSHAEYALFKNVNFIFTSTSAYKLRFRLSV